MDLAAREFVSVNRAPPVTLSVASASALLASMASSVRGVSVSGPHPTPVPFPVLVNLGDGNTHPCCLHQGVSQAFLEMAACSNVTATGMCPVIPSVASAFAHQGVQEPHVIWVSVGSFPGQDVGVGLH